MTMSVGASGVWKQVQNISIGVSGVWKQVLNIWVGASGVWKLGYSALSVSLPASVSGNCSRTTAGSCSASTAEALATASGGSGSYSFAWSFVSGSNATITTPHSNGAVFTRSGAVANPANVLTGVFRCTVTDTVTGATASATLDATTRHTLSV
jgi:hypothetical protein